MLFGTGGGFGIDSVSTSTVITVATTSVVVSQNQT